MCNTPFSNTKSTKLQQPGPALLSEGRHRQYCCSLNTAFSKETDRWESDAGSGFYKEIIHPDAVVFGVVDHTPFPEEEIHAGPALRFFYCIALLLLKVPCIAVQYAISPREQLFLVRLKFFFLLLLLFLLCEPGRVLPIYGV